MKTHTLLIAGQTLTVRSAADPAYVEGLAADLEARVTAVGSQGAGLTSAILMVALGLLDELHRCGGAEARLSEIEKAVRGRAAALRAAAGAPTPES